MKRCLTGGRGVSGPEEYDLCVIGCGPAGFAAAIRAWDHGKTVCLIEKQSIGGAGVFNGALTSKTLWQLSRRVRGFKDMLLEENSGMTYLGKFDTIKDMTLHAGRVKTIQMEVQLEALAKPTSRAFLETYFQNFKPDEHIGDGDDARPDGVCQPDLPSAKENGGLTIDGGDLDKMSADKTFIDKSEFSGKITTICGNASFLDPYTVEITGNGAPMYGTRRLNRINETRIVRAKNFVIATGSVPRNPPNVEHDGKRILTSDDILNLNAIPKTMAIIGAGVIGCEFAAIFSNLGQTKVHLINERRSRLLPSEDSDLSQFITTAYTHNGVTIHNDCIVSSVQVTPSGVTIQLQDTIDQSAVSTVDVDCVLYAIGRVPKFTGLGLERANLTLKTNRGVSSVDANTHGQSIEQPHIYLAGDITADIGLVSVAEMEGRHAVEHMYSKHNADNADSFPGLSYENVSSIMFLRPEVACVGMNEQEAIRQQIPHKVAVIGLDITNRGIINRPQYAKEYVKHPSSEDMTGPKSRARRIKVVDSRLEHTGFIKMVVTDDGKATLLGMRAVGEDSSAIIQAAAMIIKEKGSVHRLSEVIHPHPAITEGVQECARMLLGESIYKPHVFASSWLRRYIPTKGDLKPSYKSVGLVPSYGANS